jgi:hypothetical protein
MPGLIPQARQCDFVFILWKNLAAQIKVITYPPDIVKNLIYKFNV